MKSNNGPKKSNSYSKISSDFDEKRRALEKQTLKYVRSAKNISKSMQDDKPTEVSAAYRQANKS